jgi:hypothetical protein
MPSYEQNKQHIYNWREKNKDRQRELNLIHKRRSMLWLSAKREFLNILFNI